MTPFAPVARALAHLELQSDFDLQSTEVLDDNWELDRAVATAPAAMVSFEWEGQRYKLVIWEDESRETEPSPPPVVCDVCNDTHQMHLGGEDEDDRIVMCTSCPVPCQQCRAGGKGAFCGTTPCPCACHRAELDRVTGGGNG